MDINLPIYLDYNATTPVAPEVVNEMLPFFLSAYGNPSSGDHMMGWKAEEAVRMARESIAQAINAKPTEVYFTAGATEGINQVLRGFLTGNDKHIITLKSEHNAVLDTCIDLESKGVRVSYLDVDNKGLINLDALKNTISDQTTLVCVMLVNNETGVIQPIKDISSICKDRGAVLMSDATQAIGKMPVDTNELGIDITVGSAHKLYGPKGVGFLYIKDKYAKNLRPLITGGGQELKKRAGTTNVSGIIGMAKALDLAIELMDEDKVRIESLKNYFEERLGEELEIKVTAKSSSRLYNCSNICFNNVDSQQIMLAIGAKVAASRGSACSSERIEPSHVLTAMAMSEEDALSSIRFSFGRYTTKNEVDESLKLIIETVKRLTS